MLVADAHLRDVSQDERDAMPDADFAGKGQSFPIRQPEDVAAAAHAIGRAGPDNYSSDQLKKNIIRIAKRKGAAFVAQLPDAWKTEDHHDDIETLRGVTLIGTVSLAASGTASQSWIQVAKTGEFVSSRYGEFAITKANLEQMLRNFKEKMPQPPTKLPVDYDHLSMDPQRPGDGKAAGWFVDLELRNNGGELWGLVEWTPDAADAISKKEYQFVSPSFARNYTNKQGKKIGTTLLAAAITNHPFLEGMAPLTLCADGDLAIQLASASARSVHVNRPVEPAGDLSMAKKTFKMTDVKGNPVEVDEDEIDGSDYVKSMKADHAAALKKAKDDAMDAAKKNLRADDQEFLSLRQRVDEQNATILELRNGRETDRKLRLRDQAEARFDKLVSIGKATPAEKERALKLAQRDIDASKTGDEKVWDLFEDWCADHAKVVVKLRAVHGNDPEGTGEAGGDPEEQMFALAAAKMKADPKLSEPEALGLVARENPELYRRANDASVLMLNGHRAVTE